jgi:hypothetical protein
LEIRKSHGGFFFLRTIIASRRNLENPRQSDDFWGQSSYPTESLESATVMVNFFEFWQKKARRPVLADGRLEENDYDYVITRA